MKKFSYFFVLLFLFFGTFTLSACNANLYYINFYTDNEKYYEITNNSGLVVMPEPPTKTGYEFKGWYYDQNFTNKFDNENIKNFDQKNAVNLYAKWEKINYTITYYLNDGINGNNPLSYNIESEDIVLENAYKDGCNFVGWFLDSDFENQIETIQANSTENLNLYAKFEDIKYSIFYQLNGGINNAQNPYELTQNESVQLKEPKKYAYNFIGWYDSPTYTNKITKIENINKNYNLYAKWEINADYFGNLPLVQIVTNNNQFPTDKENYVNCGFSISNCNNASYNFEKEIKNSLEDENAVGFRLRGNSTLIMDKKSFRVKSNTKQSILGLQENKSWVLLADYKDNSKIRNYTAFTLASSFNSLSFTPTPNHVVLFINDEYYGLYLLTEQVDEKLGRVNVESDINPSTQTEFPFFVEMSAKAIAEGINGVDKFTPDYFYPITIKWPEYDDRNLTSDTDVVFNYIQEYINAAFKTLTTNEKVKVSFRDELVGFSDLVDVDNFLEYWLVNEIMFNKDSMNNSVFISKTANGKLKFGPVWDFDWSLSYVYSAEPYDKSEINYAYRNCLLKSQSLINAFIQNQDNYNLLCQKWNNVKANILTTTEKLRTYKQNIQTVAEYDAIYWYGNNGSFNFDMQYDYVRLFLNDRYDYLNNILTEENYSVFQNPSS